MGISPGWADNYDSTIPGQELSMAGLSDGRYAVVDQDPENRLYETDDTNNRVVFTFDVTGLGTMFPAVTNIERSWSTTTWWSCSTWSWCRRPRPLPLPLGGHVVVVVVLDGNGKADNGKGNGKNKC